MLLEPPRQAASWQWLVLLFTAASFIESAFVGHIRAFTPIYLPQLGVPYDQVATWTGIIIVSSNAIGIPFLPLWGALADRYARQPIIVRSFVAHLLAACLMLLAGDIWTFLLGNAMISFALGNSGLMMTTLSECTPAQRTALAFAIVNGAGPLGFLAGPALGGWLVDAYGLPVLLAVDSLLLLLTILALLLSYRDSYRSQERRPVLQMAVESVRIIWGSRQIRALFPAMILLFAGWFAAFVYAPLVIDHHYDGARLGTAVGSIMGLGGLASFTISPLLGALADRVGHWRLLFTGGIAAALLWPAGALAPDLVSFAAIWALLSGTVSAVLALSFAVLAQLAPSAVRGRVMAFAYLPVIVGAMLGAALGGIAVQISTLALFVVAAGLTACGLALLGFARRTAAGQ